MRTFTTNGDRVEMFVPVMKFDQRTGVFSGRSAIEEPDGHSEICDIEKSWPAIVADAEQQKEISGGKSVGVLRRQHDRTKSIGKLTKIERGEWGGKPAIYIEGLCTDEQAKSDAATGVLTGISIRGLIDRWPDETVKGLTRYAWKYREEDSLVDRPAAPHTLIEVMKSDGGVEMVRAKGYEPPQGFLCRAERFHARKDDARECESDHASESAKGLPSKIEAKSATTDASKSLWLIADLVACLSTLLNITSNTEYEEMWEAINEGDTAGLPLATQLRGIAQQVFDALQAMIADERRELDDQVADQTEAAMSHAMNALRHSETAKQLIKSLRVPRGNGSISPTKAEDKMEVTHEAMKSQVQSGIAEALKAFVAPLAKALGLTMSTPDVADVAEALKSRDAANGEALKAATTKIDAIEAQLGTVAESLAESQKALAQTLALTHQVKVADPMSLTEVLKAIEDKPAPARGQLRTVPVSKAQDDEALKAKDGEPAPVDPATLPARDSRTRVPLQMQG